jgi:hypothetical protein
LRVYAAYVALPRPWAEGGYPCHIAKKKVFGK